MKRASLIKPSKLDATRDEMDRAIMNRLSRNPKFAEMCNTAARHLRGGKNFFEVREILGVTNDNTWRDIKYVALRRCFSPETAATECILATKAHVELAADNYNRAVKTGNPDKIAKALLVLSTLEQRKFEVLQALGMLKPPVEVDGGQGYASGEVIDVENEVERKLDEQLLSQAGVQREVKSAVPIELLSHTPHERPADRLEEVPLDAHHPSRSVSAHHHAEVQPDGSEHVLHPVDAVVVQNKART